MPKDTKTPNVSGARFVIGAAQASQFPDWQLPEIAFGGRSNVGKSSLLRVLAGSRRLVRVSRTPGRTREVNFFELKLAREPCAFVDLPGYGYAKVPGAMRSRWGQTLEDYFNYRPQLAALVLLVDARRGPTGRPCGEPAGPGHGSDPRAAVHDRAVTRWCPGIAGIAGLTTSR